MTTVFFIFAALALGFIGILVLSELRNLARHRTYKSGTVWCVWRWTDVESEYILRLHLVKTPWFAVCLHWINKPDREPWLHDHPVSFLSLILRGWYTEARQGPDGERRVVRRRWFNVIRASRDDRHRITHVAPNGALTLCLMGPKTRSWGFHAWEELEPGGWIFWKDYYARLKAGEDMRQHGVLRRLEHLATRLYTEGRVRALAGCPDGTVHELETRVIDLGPAEDFDADAVTAEYEK